MADTSYLIKWWSAPKNEAHQQIMDLVHKLTHEQTARTDRNIRCLQLYGTPDLVHGTSATFAFSSMMASAMPENRVKINIIKSVSDTAVSMIGKMKPKATFLTDRGDAGLQTQAKKLTKYVEGAFYLNDIYSLHKQMFRDATVLDIGALKHYLKDGKICTERVLATELWFDPADTLYGHPTHMYQTKIYHKDVLIGMYPEKAGAIRAATALLTRQGVSARAELDDFLTVVEAWHLPVDKKGSLGRHVICIETDTLLDEKYTKNHFPFTFFNWSKPVIGFTGQSLADSLTGNQIEINKMLRIIQKSFHLGAAFKVFLEYGSKIVKEHITNEIGSIIYYSGTPPQFYVPKTVHEEYFRHLEWLISNSYEEIGISQLTASSRKPAGLESAKALREYNDIQTERFASVSQDYEATFLETAKHYLELSKDLKEEGYDFEVKGQSKKFIESIKWSDIDIDAEAYVMKMFPTSLLPSEPAGKLAYVQELLSAGLVEQDWALELLDFPDTEAYSSLKNAALNDILDTLDEMINQGKYTPPEPYQNLALGLKLVQAAYLRGKHDGVPDQRLDLLRRWISQADRLQEKAKMAAQAGNPAPAQAQGIDQAEQMASPEQAQLPAPIPGANQ